MAEGMASAAIRIVASGNADGSFIVDIRINNPWVAGTGLIGAGLIGVIGLGAYYFRHKERLETATRAALQGPPAADGRPDPEVVRIERGSIFVKLLCHTRQSFMEFISDYATRKLHQRLHEELSNIGFEGAFEIAIEQVKEVQRPDPDELSKSTAKSTSEEPKCVAVGAGAGEAMPTMYPSVDTFLAVIQSCEILDPVLKDVLVQLAVFKDPFTTQRAKLALKIEDDHQVLGHLSDLISQSLLVHRAESPETRYSLPPAVRDVCLMACATNPLIGTTFREAKQRFIEGYKEFLNDLFQKFYSKNSLEAIKAYQEEEENIKQLLHWCAEDPSIDDALRKECVDTFNRVGELLAKMIHRDEFERLFTKMAEKCRGDERRMAECWISVGIKIIFSCACYPKLCDPAEKRAKKYFHKAKPISKNTSFAKNSLAQLHAKLGRCNAAEGKFEKGQKNIKVALEIRADMNDKVMLGATYNDLAVAQTLNQQHEEAIKTEHQTLKIYDENLGEQHPFTATIYNNMGNNYLELQEFDKAIDFFEKALVIREKVLPDHPDGAKSLFGLAMAHKGKANLKAAKGFMEKAAFIEEKVFKASQEGMVKVHHELADILKKLNHPEEAEKEMEKAREWQGAHTSTEACCTFINGNQGI